MTRLESETIILFNDHEPTAIISTRSPTTIRRLQKKGYIFSQTPPNSGLWRTTIPKRLCYPRSKKSPRQTPSIATSVE